MAYPLWLMGLGCEDRREKDTDLVPPASDFAVTDIAAERIKSKLDAKNGSSPISWLYLEMCSEAMMAPSPVQVFLAALVGSPELAARRARDMLMKELQQHRGGCHLCPI
jgi:hypothetical protein